VSLTVVIEGQLKVNAFGRS